MVVVYKACVRSMLMYGAETWAMKAGVFQKLRATKRRMLRMICGVTLKDMVESTGCKVNISKTKCMGWCTKGGSSGSRHCVCGKRVGIKSIHCATCGYWVHGRCSGVQGSLARVAQGFVCKVCRAERRKAADEFHFEDVKLECVCEFAYLGDMLNDTGGMEQAVAARVRAVWMKVRELSGILCTRGASLRMKGVYGMCAQHVDG